MNSIVKLQVNETRLVKNLALAFSSQTTFIAELMQNARRAGASVIQITYATEHHQGKKEGVLTIEDNGGGIKDWQDLLSIADTGWSEGIQEEERPYGMGFFSCLATAKTVKIESGAHMMEFDQNSVLGFESIQVVANDIQINGTRITLMGLTLDLKQVCFALEKYCKGFPVQVIFNGTEMDQKYSPSALKASKDEFAAVVELEGIGLCAFRKPTANTSFTALTLELFLLGMPVASSHSPSDAIIHLDPRYFPARLPDRDSLIDAADKLKMLKMAAHDWWIMRMGEIKSHVHVEELWEQYRREALHMLKCGMLNDIDRIPADLLETVPEFSMLSWKNGGSRRSSGWVQRSDLEHGEVILCKDLCHYHDGPNAVTHEIAHRLGWNVLCVHADANHWIFHGIEKLQDDLDSAMVDFQSSATGDIELDGKLITVHLTDNAVLRWKDNEVTVSDTCVVFENEDNSDELTLVLAGNASASEAVSKISCFSGEGDLTDEDYLNDSKNELFHLILTLQGASPATSLKSVLADTDYKYLGNTQNSCVLVQNAEKAHELYTLDLSSITEAVTLYRHNGMQDEKVMGLLEGILKDLAAHAMKHEQYVLMSAIHASFCNQGSMSELLRRDPTESFKTSLIDQFTARVVGMSNWDEIQKDIDAAVIARIDALMADPAL